MNGCLAICSKTVKPWIVGRHKRNLRRVGGCKPYCVICIPSHYITHSYCHINNGLPTRALYQYPLFPRSESICSSRVSISVGLQIVDAEHTSDVRVREGDACDIHAVRILNVEDVHTRKRGVRIVPGNRLEVHMVKPWQGITLSDLQAPPHISSAKLFSGIKSKDMFEGFGPRMHVIVKGQCNNISRAKEDRGHDLVTRIDGKVPDMLILRVRLVNSCSIHQ